MATKNILFNHFSTLLMRADAALLSYAIPYFIVRIMDDALYHIGFTQKGSVIIAAVDILHHFPFI